LFVKFVQVLLREVVITRMPHVLLVLVNPIPKVLVVVTIPIVLSQTSWIDETQWIALNIGVRVNAAK